MKQIKGSFKIVLALLTVFFFIQSEGFAQGQEAASAATPNPIPTPQQHDSLLAKMDAIDISLLTVGPGNEVWSLYGHTALRYQDKNRRQDLAINYGAFNFEQDYFLLRFVFGATDYEMETIPMRLFMDVYQAEGRWVREQQLNLTREEKLIITNALYKNSLPENVTYRYNFFYDNCTTRARNMIVQHLNISGYNADNHWNGESYRTMIHQWTDNHRWTRFGNDLLLGIGSDFNTEKEASFFLPDSVSKEFETMVLTNPDGSKRQLVSHSRMLIEPLSEDKRVSFANPLSLFCQPRFVFGLLFAAILLTTWLLQYRKKHSLQWLDALLLLLSGAAGWMLLVMVFSQHPTVRGNLQILLLNPLSLVFLFPTLKAARKGFAHGYWKVLAVCICLFLVGGFWQTYAEGMYFLALSLLVRCWANLRKK